MTITRTGQLRRYVADACETIDAAVFSGDLLHVDAEREALNAYAERWMRAVCENVEEAPAPAAVAISSDGITEALRAFDAAMEACSDYPDTSGDIDGLVEAVRKARAALAAAPAQEGARDAGPDVLMGYMHPGAFHPHQFTLWKKGNACAIRLNGWRQEHLQVPVYAKQSAIDAAIDAARAAQGGAA